MTVHVRAPNTDRARKDSTILGYGPVTPKKTKCISLMYDASRFQKCDY